MVLHSSSDTLALLRSQRHSFGNHLQVISGWLQMGRTDRAAAYIDQVAAKLVAESALLNRVEPEVALFIITLSLQAEPLGVAIIWQVDGPVTTEELATVAAACPDALARAAQGPEGERRLVVRLGPSCGVHTPGLPGEA